MARPVRVQAARLDGLPGFLIAPVRSALVGLGVDGRAVSDSGELVPEPFVTSFYDTVEIRTRVTPPIKVNLKTALSDTALPSPPLVKWLKPTVILTGRAGRIAVAPHGEAAPSSGVLLAVPIIAAVGLGLLLGKFVWK